VGGGFVPSTDCPFRLACADPQVHSLAVTPSTHPQILAGSQNFFRYMKENFALDALVDYQIEPDDPTRDVPNPERKKVEKLLKVARAELAEIERS